MTSVFISYSTLDADVGRQLFNALTAQGRDLWMDWKSIQLTADWWEEIKDGIETSDNFVFLVSPNSIGSPICHLEVQYACSLNKRMIPVLIHETDERKAYADLLTRDLNELQRALLGKQDLIDLARDNWKLLSSIQWINLARDGFEVGLRQLVEAVDTDLEYIQEHTRLLLRAKDWARRGKTPSLLLRGDDLTAAEAWLKTSEQLKPPATDDHRAYLTESRRAEDAETAREAKQRRLAQRLALATAIFVGLAVTLGIVGFFALQSREASIVEANNARAAEAEAATQVAVFGATLTPIPATLTRVAEQVAEGEGRIESLRLAALASERLSNTGSYPALDVLYQTPPPYSGYQSPSEATSIAAARVQNVLTEAMGDPEAAALLAIRALRTTYTAQADSALTQALERLYRGRIFSGHEQSVTDLDYSPDGRLLASASYDGTVRVWDAATGETLHILTGHTDRVTSVDYSPDGRTLLTASHDHTLRLWNADDGVEIRVLNGHTDSVMDASFSPDGRTIVSVARDSTVRLWDAASGVERDQIESGYAERVRFTADGGGIIVPRFDNLELWSVDNVRLLPSPVPDDFDDFIYTPDGRYRAYIDTQAATVWDGRTNEQMSTLDWTFITQQSVEFSPDGRWIVSASQGGEAGDDTVRLWDTQSGRQVLVREGYFASRAVFSPDSRFIAIAAGDGSIIVWDMLATRLMSADSDQWVRDLAFSPDGGRLLLTSNLAAYGWNTDTGAQTFEITPNLLVGSAVIRPDGRQIVTAMDEINQFNEYTFDVWDITGETPDWLYSHDSEDMIFGLAYSPDSRFLATTSPLTIWDAETGEPVHALDSTSSIYLLRYRSDGRALLGVSGGTIIVWDTENGQPIQQFSIENNEVIVDATFSPDNRSIALALQNSTLQIWDVTSGDLVRSIPVGTGSTGKVQFSPDGRYLVALEYPFFEVTHTYLWDAGTGELLYKQDGTFIGFSPDNSHLLINIDDDVHIIEILNGEVARVLQGHTGVVQAARYHPDGTLIATASRDGTVRLWDANIEATIAYACEHVFRDLHQSERIDFGISDDDPTCPQFERPNFPDSPP